MIKNFSTYINEDYFSKLANRKDNNIVRKENEITEDFVRSFVREGHYEKNIKSITIRKENYKTIVDIDGDFYLKIDVREIPFQFGKITGKFNCAQCKKLTSLEGCPKEVGGYFSCNSCPNLTSLEGCPEKVGGYFYCSFCSNLSSLEGCPKEVGDEFHCLNCGKEFTEEEVKSLCDVKGDIYV